MTNKNDHILVLERFYAMKLSADTNLTVKHCKNTWAFPVIPINSVLHHCHSYLITSNLGV